MRGSLFLLIRASTLALGTLALDLLLRSAPIVVSEWLDDATMLRDPIYSTWIETLLVWDRWGAPALYALMVAGGVLTASPTDRRAMLLPAVSGVLAVHFAVWIALASAVPVGSIWFFPSVAFIEAVGLMFVVRYVAAAAVAGNRHVIRVTSAICVVAALCAGGLMIAGARYGSTGLRAVLVERETLVGIPSRLRVAKVYEAMLANRGVLPARVRICEMLRRDVLHNPVATTDSFVGWVVQRRVSGADSWTDVTVVRIEDICEPQWEVVMARPVYRWLWPLQRVSGGSERRSGGGGLAVGDMARFVVFVQDGSNDERALASDSFMVTDD